MGWTRTHEGDRSVFGVSHHPRPACRKHTTRCLLPVLALLLVILMTHPVSATYSVIVNDGSEECFVTRTPKEPAGRYVVSGNYDLLDDGTSARPLSVVLFDGQSKPRYTSMFGRSEGTFSVVGNENQRFTLCIQNGPFAAHAGMARSEGMDDDDAVGTRARDGLDRNVGWSLRVRSTENYAKSVKEQGAENKEKSESEKAVEQMLLLSNDLLDELDDLADHQ